MLLHMAGPETQEVFDTLTPANDTYDKALEALTSHFSVKKNVPFERNVFHQTKQKAGESIEQFVTRVRKLTASCEYGDQTEDQIRDQIIATCSSTGLRKKLLTETDLTLAKVIEIAQVMETAHHQVKEIEAKHEQPFLQTPSAQNDEDYLNFFAGKMHNTRKLVLGKAKRNFKKAVGDVVQKVTTVANAVEVKMLFVKNAKRKGISQKCAEVKERQTHSLKKNKREKVQTKIRHHI